MFKIKQPFEKPIFTRHQLIALILPLVIEQALAISVGLFDTLMVASIGEASISGVSLVDAINVLVIQVFAALATGGAVVVSQYIGKRSAYAAKASANQLVFITMVSGVGLTAVVLLFQKPLLRLVFGALDPEIMSQAEAYFFISAFSYPFIAMYNAVSALFRAQGNSKISMFSSLCMNIINISGNALFIFVFKWGVFGAGFATLLARMAAAILVLVLLQNETNPLRVDNLFALRPQKLFIRQILAIGVPSGIENGMFQFGRLAVSSLVAVLPTAAIAANAMANSISMVYSIASNAIGLALITVVGRCLGAKEKEQAKWYSNLLVGCAVVSIWVPNLLALVIVPYCLPLLNMSAEATALTGNIMAVYSVVSLFIFNGSFTLANALRAAGDAKFTMWVSVCSMWAFRVISSYIFVVVFQMGVTGVWLGMYIDWTCRCLVYGWRYFSWRWLDKKVI